MDKTVSPRRFLVLPLAGFADFAPVLRIDRDLGGNFVFGESGGAGDRCSNGAGGVGSTRSDPSYVGMAAHDLALGNTAGRVPASALGGLLYGVTSGDPPTLIGMPAKNGLVPKSVTIVGMSAYGFSRRTVRMCPRQIRFIATWNLFRQAGIPLWSGNDDRKE